MWLMKMVLLVSFFGVLESYAGPKNSGLKIHKHIIEVTDISLEQTLPRPEPMEEEEMVARISVKYY